MSARTSIPHDGQMIFGIVTSAARLRLRVGGSLTPLLVRALLWRLSGRRSTKVPGNASTSYDFPNVYPNSDVKPHWKGGRAVECGGLENR